LSFSVAIAALAIGIAALAIGIALIFRQPLLLLHLEC
jgi:hypothetical protein